MLQESSRIQPNSGAARSAIGPRKRGIRGGFEAQLVVSKGLNAGRGLSKDGAEQSRRNSPPSQLLSPSSCCGGTGAAQASEWTGERECESMSAGHRDLDRGPLLRTARVMARSRASYGSPQWVSATRAAFAVTTFITAWFVVTMATCLGHNPTRPQGGPAMGQKTDKIIGRAKQALGAVTGNEKMKREGQRQEDKGNLKGKLDSTIGKTQDALGDLKKKVDRR